jgi:ABC-type multidrug transport system ATPase subunit
MKIILDNVGKRFPPDWIFKKINLEFNQDEKYALIGPNGSGKSTLLKIISGHLSPSQGKMLAYQGLDLIPADRFFNFISFTAPYMDLVEEFTLFESVQFHRKFKPFRDGMKENDFIELLKLKKAENKPLKYFSSGMKQKVKLGLALFSEVPLILLDEPTTNLDVAGADWYAECISRIPKEIILIVASNTPGDYESFNHKIFMKDYKKKSDS